MQFFDFKYNLLILMATILIIKEVNLEMLNGLPERPERPRIFRSKQELVDYINKVNHYYGIVGRPRFGKRVASDENINSIEKSDYSSEGIINTIFSKKARKTLHHRW